MAGLDPKEIRQVLRYWLALIRQEEALADRPRARSPLRGPFPVDLIEPRPGTPYFKLALEGGALDFLLRTTETVEEPLNPERTAFLSHWLRISYQRESAAVFGRPEPRGQQIHLGFPTFHARRSEELACLIRFGGTLNWLDDEGAAWVPPDYHARKSRSLPPLPTGLRLTAEVRGAEAPYFLDAQLLSRTLGVVDEELADFFTALREAGDVSGPDMVAAVCDLLERDGRWTPPLAEAPEGVSLAELAERLVTAARRRLPPGDQSVFPIGLVTDDSRIQASWHLQRDLLTLLKHPPGDGPWGRATPLWHYLSGQPAPAGHHLPRGLRVPRALTPGQLDTAARFLGSTLTAAQGPPGTGKTDLILHLVADTLVTRARRLLEGRAMGRTLLLVTSTNNRAVDNVLDPLARELPEGALPLGLRAGNQEVTASLTAETLARARTWLRSQDTADAAARHAAALAEFEGALADVDQALAPFEVGQTERARREQLVSRLADLDEDLARAPGSLDEAEEAQRRVKALRRVLVDLEQMVEKRTRSSVERALALWQRKAVEKDLVAEAERALAAVELTLEVRLPPAYGEDDPEDEIHDAWEDAVADALEAVEAARDAVQVTLRAHQLRKQRDAVAAELAELELSVAEAPAAPPALAGAHANLFALANRVRETWAILHAGELEPALRRALERTAGRGSLRSIFEKDLETASWLRRLFPVMGCTLLSLGNVFPPEPGVVERVVVDEAGQCHPAYALAALMRAERALVIGDVHQLEPVVRLTGIDEQRVRRISDVDLTDAVLAPYRVHAENPTSAQSLADRAVKVRPQLRDHFRCQPAIIGLSDRLCGYHLAVHTPARSLVGQVPWLTDAVLLAAVEGQQVQARGSWANPMEADVVLEILRQLGRRGIPWTDIALLTPYVGQLDLLRQRLRGVGVPLETDREAWSATQPALFETGALATGTVHRFQGGERTVVIFSTVVGRDRSLGFLNGRVNLVNVAVSRARDHLIIVGDPAVLARGPHTRVLTERATRLRSDALR